MVQLGEERSSCRCQLPSQSTFGSQIPALLNLLRTCNRNPHTRTAVTYAHKHTEYSYFTLFHNLVCFPFYKNAQKVRHTAVTLLNLVLFWLRLVNDSGWETICSAEERAGGKGEQVRKTGRHWGIDPAEWGHYTHTHTRLRLKNQAERQAPCGDTLQLGSTLGEERDPHITHTHTHT